MDFAFSKKNYILLFVGLAFMASGLILMVGGGSEDPTQFSDEIFNFQRLTLAPILLAIGFIVEIFAIMYRFGYIPLKVAIEDENMKKLDSEDKNKKLDFLLLTLSFLFPLIGLLLYAIWKDSKPLDAKQCGIAAIWGLVIGGVIVVISAAALA